MKMSAHSVFFAATLSLGIAPAQAHHTWPVDMDKAITVKGTVTGFKWENPHPMISLDVTTANGNVELWEVGGPAITRMEAKGWTKDTVKTGDVITGIGYQFRDGQKIIRLDKITFADGKEMVLYGR